MCQFYLTFPNCHALRSNLSWTHYRMLMRVENKKARDFYLDRQKHIDLDGEHFYR